MAADGIVICFMFLITNTLNVFTDWRFLLPILTAVNNSNNYMEVGRNFKFM